jgi:hypothetical protein
MLLINLKHNTIAKQNVKLKNETEKTDENCPLGHLRERCETRLTQNGCHERLRRKT